MSVIISGFPGVGKTTLAKSNPSMYIDLDSSPFHYEMVGEERKERPGWVYDYVDSIQEHAKRDEYLFIFISSHEEVREELEGRGIEYFVVIPSIEDRDAYILRYLKRGSNIDFIRKLSQHYFEWIQRIQDEYMRDDSKIGIALKLRPGEYLSDVLL